MASSTDNIFERKDENESEASSCQMCLSANEELKAFSSCGHGVCKHCFEDIIQSTEVCLRCPVCKEELTSTKINTKAEKMESCENDQRIDENERSCILNLQEKCKTKIEKIEEVLLEIDHCQQVKRKRACQLKQEIHEMADGLVEMIRKQEREFCEKLEEDAAREVEKIDSVHKLTLEAFLEKSKQFVSATETVLSGPTGDASVLTKENIILHSMEIIEANLYPSGVELIASDSHSFTFETNCKLVEKLVKEGIGRLKANHSPVSKVNPHRLSRMLSVHFHTPEVLLTLRAQDIGLDTFSPISLASDGKAIAVADPENHSILLLDKNGKLRKQFTAKDSTFGPATFSGLSFTKGNEILAVHGSTHIHFINPETGRFRLSYQTSPNHGVKYCFISCDEKGRVIVTCEPAMKGYRACVFVHSESPFGEPELKFGFTGENRLEFPFRALYHKDEYFVSDMEKGSIMVFSKDGSFVRQFGNRERGEGELVLPIGLVIHPQSETAFVCDWGSNSLQVYKLNGSHVYTYTLQGRPTDVALLEDRTVVVCSKDDKWIKFLFVP